MLHRLPTETFTEPDGRITDCFDLPHDEASLLRLFKLLVRGACERNRLRPVHPGSRLRDPRRVTPARSRCSTGYLTVDFGTWHFTCASGTHRGTTASPCPPELARHRQVKRAALFRSWGRSCLPASWGLRLWNGKDEQMITVFFPNPYLDVTGHHRLREPDWSRLHLWDLVRREFLGLEPDPGRSRERQRHERAPRDRLVVSRRQPLSPWGSGVARLHQSPSAEHRKRHETDSDRLADAWDRRNPFRFGAARADRLRDAPGRRSGNLECPGFYPTIRRACATRTRNGSLG